MMKKSAILFLFALAACNSPEYKAAPGQPAYFNLKAYFQQQAAALQQRNPQVKKTVLANGKEETKELKIASWTKELSSFIDADMNKRAWAGEFRKAVTDSTETYTSSNEKVPVKQVRIYRSNKQISGVQIFIKNDNYLYTSTDTLSYYPGKRYEVRKTQHIKLMDKKEYRVTGIF
jgi:hypothetical protein